MAAPAPAPRGFHRADSCVSVADASRPSLQRMDIADAARPDSNTRSQAATSAGTEDLPIFLLTQAAERPSIAVPRFEIGAKERC